MKRKRFFCGADRGGTEAVGGGVPVAELIRDVGVSELTHCSWKKQHTALEVDQVRQLKQLQEENARLKKLVAD